MPPAINQASQVSSRTGIVTSAGTLFPVNLNRKYLIIQNLNGTNPLFVKFGASASATDFDIILETCTTADDGSGGLFISGENIYTGLISVAGTTVRVTATEF